MPETKDSIKSNDAGKNKEIIDDLELESGVNSEIGENNDKNKTKTDKNSVVLSKTKIVLVKKLLENIKDNNDKLIRLLSDFISPEEEEMISIGQMGEDGFSLGGFEREEGGEGRIVEGVFDGENMIGPDGKQYSIPANYASKSKLVEGDILKLTITSRGTFVYKQIGPIERKRAIGNLEQDRAGNFYVMHNDKKLRVLTASVTYFKGNAGDEIVILVPKTGASKWAAVENIVKNK